MLIAKPLWRRPVISKRCTAAALMLALTTVFAIAPSSAARFAGKEIPDTLDSGGTTLSLVGSGLRTRFIAKLYIASLYTEPSAQYADGPELCAADDHMAIRLQIISSLVNTRRLLDAVSEGFVKATQGRTSSIQNEIDGLLEKVNTPIQMNDVFILNWRPGEGLVVSKNEEFLPGEGTLPFKEALFGIWLSDYPAQKSLKKGLLGY